MRQIVVHLKPASQGGPTVEAEGFTGSACQEVIEKLFAGLASLEDGVKKDEYYTTESPVREAEIA